jgi:3-oxoacyl-[acyl-carrier protein] reductase
MRDTALPDLTGTVALVTGASGNLGQGIALRFAQAGSAVVTHYHRDRTAATTLVDRIEAAGGSAIAIAADLTDNAACHDLVDAAASWRGWLDALVNNAGIQPVQELRGMSAAEWRTMLDTNLTSVFSCTQAAVRAMRDGGTITHIASINASQPAEGHAHYCAAKAALVMHARCAALEYGPRRIRINTVSPGLIDRPGLADDWPDGVHRWHRAAPLTRLGAPTDVGNACVFLASPMAAWITGHDLVVDGGVSAHPTW